MQDFIKSFIKSRILQDFINDLKVGKWKILEYTQSRSYCDHTQPILKVHPGIKSSQFLLKRWATIGMFIGVNCSYDSIPSQHRKPAQYVTKSCTAWQKSLHTMVVQLTNKQIVSIRNVWPAIFETNGQYCLTRNAALDISALQLLRLLR